MRSKAINKKLQYYTWAQMETEKIRKGQKKQVKGYWRGTCEERRE